MNGIAVIDGCKSGWLAMSESPDGRVDARVFGSANEVLTALAGFDAIAVDIPIGLVERGRRSCDELARKALGSPRASSVFNAPIRPILQASSREEADQISRALGNGGIGAQAWAIVPKVREWDEAMQRQPMFAPHVFEVHPEVCFWALNNHKPMDRSKHDPEGYADRKGLLAIALGHPLVAYAVGRVPRSQAKSDDVMDALVALWTARRIRDGVAGSMSAPTAIDPVGIRMAMWF